MAAADLTSTIIDSVIAAAAVVALFFSAKTLKDSQETSAEARKQSQHTAMLATSAAALLEQQKQAFAATVQPAVVDVAQDLQKILTGDLSLDPDRDISVIEPVDPSGQKMVLITIPVRNAGSGPAFMNTNRVWVQRTIVTIDGKKVAAGDETDASVAQRVLNPGETMLVRATALPNSAGDKVLRRVVDLEANFVLYVRYSDVTGKRFQSELLIRAIKYPSVGLPTEIKVRYMPVRVRLYECGADCEPVGKPFAYSGSPDDDEDEYFVTGPDW